MIESPSKELSSQSTLNAGTTIRRAKRLRQLSAKYESPVSVLVPSVFRKLRVGVFSGLAILAVAGLAVSIPTGPTKKLQRHAGANAIHLTASNKRHRARRSKRTAKLHRSKAAGTTAQTDRKDLADSSVEPIPLPIQDLTPVVTEPTHSDSVLNKTPELADIRTVEQPHMGAMEHSNTNPTEHTSAKVTANISSEAHEHIGSNATEHTSSKATDHSHPKAAEHKSHIQPTTQHREERLALSVKQLADSIARSSRLPTSGTKVSAAPLSEKHQSAPSTPLTSKPHSVPNTVLRPGSIIHSSDLSPNAVLLAKQLGVLDSLKRLEQWQTSVTKDNLQGRIELLNLKKSISETLRGSEMDIKYVTAEIIDEQCLYQELLGAYTQERDSAVAKANMASYTINGALWTITEALTLPAPSNPAFAGAAGVVGIVAGIVPSLTAAYGLKQVSGKKHSAAAAPNMLAKLFDRKMTNHVEYPDSVWNFLNSQPSDDPKRTRRDIIIDKWLKDPNIPMLKNRKSEATLDTLTASTYQKKKVTMAVLSARIIMLSRVSAEVSKMNRLLNELELCLRGKKRA